MSNKAQTQLIREQKKWRGMGHVFREEFSCRLFNHASSEKSSVFDTARVQFSSQHVCTLLYEDVYVKIITVVDKWYKSTQRGSVTNVFNNHV